MTKRLISTDVVIVGGGVIGASIAYFASQTENDIMLIERGRVGQEGSTSISKGILRVYDPILELAKISKQGMDYYLNWEKNDAPGARPSLHPGMLYRIKPENVSTAKQVAAAISSEDYPIYLNQTPEDTLKQSGVNWKSTDNIIYEPYGGYGNPLLTAQQFIAGAQDNGTRILENTTVLSLHPIFEDAVQLWEVITPEKRIHCNQVILAAGAYSMDLLQNLSCYTRSISIPKFKIEHQKHQTTSASLIDEVENTFIRPLDSSSFIAGSQLFETTHWSNLDVAVNNDQISDAQARVQKTLQASIQLESEGGQTGFDAYTQDLMPMVGELENSKGLFIATGFSGRGYKMAPAIGIGVSDWLCKVHGQTYQLPLEVDFSSFSPNRFSNHKITPIAEIA